ncbi:MAG: hypothetical protein HY816_20150 [Candidatus Wallbacteria bacterium]|nr:hypothetical protein [Candidatus Wallbacteria bacterium]
MLVEGARLGRSGWGCEFDARYGILACRNVELVDGATVRLEVGKDARSELKYVGGLACIITSPPYPNAHDAGSSEKQEVLRQKAKLHAGQGYRIAPGHLLHGNWRTNFIELWQACRPALAYNGVLCVITKDWVEEDQRFDFTRIVAEGIRDAGYELVGRHWRVVDRVGFHTFGHRTQYRKKTGRVPLFIDHEDVIIARSAE